MTMNRRRFLTTTGTALTAFSLAGCMGEDSSGGDTPTGTATATGTTTTATETATTTGTGTETATETGTGTTEGGGIIESETETQATTTGSSDTRPVVEPAPTTVDQFLANANFYDGNMVVGVPLVAVGAGEQQLGFDPAAIKVSVGTEVTWEWASGAKPHTVVSIGQVGADERTLDSGPPREGNGITYRYTFERPGIYRYVCEPHRDQGARGAVVVTRESVGGNGSG